MDDTLPADETRTPPLPRTSALSAPLTPRLCEQEPLPGQIKMQPEDFVVDELPAYLPSGDGEHCFVHVRKRDLTTQEAIKRLLRALPAELSVAARDVGRAGVKDRVGVTSQWLSIPRVPPETLLALELEGIEILAAARHANKLKPGHLAGNRFSLWVRGVGAERAADAITMLSRLEAEGVPNYFGTQRFGRGGSNLERAARWLVEGGRSPRDRFEKKMLVSAYQSAAFNELCAARVQAGTLGHALPGDVLRKEDSGGIFVLGADASEDEREDARARAASFALSPAGPMFGPKMRAAEGAIAEQEAEVAARWGFGRDFYGRAGKLALGTRRPYRVRLEGLEHRFEGDDLWLGFTLPPGAYATVVTAELLGS